MSKRIGRTVVEEHGGEFEVVWPCAEATVTRAAPALDPFFDDLPPVTSAGARQMLLALLEEKDIWRTTELRAESCLTQSMFWSVLQTMRHAGQVVTPDRGWIALRKVTVAA